MNDSMDEKTNFSNSPANKYWICLFELMISELSIF